MNTIGVPTRIRPGERPEPGLAQGRGEIVVACWNGG